MIGDAVLVKGKRGTRGKMVQMGETKRGKYNLKARAERQQQTRQRIVESAWELHRANGPARTTITDIAKRAGVQRRTVYNHFPDELSLGRHSPRSMPITGATSR
jgi:transcriptional regulator GlxA family with amidase domain